MTRREAWVNYWLPGLLTGFAIGVVTAVLVNQ